MQTKILVVALKSLRPRCGASAPRDTYAILMGLTRGREDGVDAYPYRTAAEGVLRFWTYLLRSIRLRCPQCGRGRIYYAFSKMFNHCVFCGLVYERESGYFLGAIYFNYGLTALVVTVGYPLLVFGLELPANIIFWAAMAFCILFPLWFFRYARSLWIAFDQLCDPGESRPRIRHEETDQE